MRRNNIFKFIRNTICFLFIAVALCSCGKKHELRIIHHETSASSADTTNVTDYEEYIINLRSKKIHKLDCGTATLINEENRDEYVGDIRELFEVGYTVCGNCF